MHLLNGCSTRVQVDHSHLSCGPSRTLTDIGHTEAETVSAAQRIVLLEVVESGFTQITVGSHHVHLMSNRCDVRHSGD